MDWAEAEHTPTHEQALELLSRKGVWQRQVERQQHDRVEGDLVHRNTWHL